MPAAYPRVPEPAMELPVRPHDRNNGQGKRRKERATSAETKHFRPPYSSISIIHPSAGGDFFLVQGVYCRMNHGLNYESVEEYRGRSRVAAVSSRAANPHF